MCACSFQIALKIFHLALKSIAKTKKKRETVDMSQLDWKPKPYYCNSDSDEGQYNDYYNEEYYC